MRAKLVFLTGVAVLGALLAILLRPARERSGVEAEAEFEKRASASAAGRPVTKPPPGHAISSSPSATTVNAGTDVIASTDPASKDYDPMTLITVTHSSARDLMNKEPRNPAFANRRELALERRLTARLRKRLDFDTKIDVSCRTSSCEVAIHGASSVDQMNSALDAMEPLKISGAYEIGTTGGEGDPQRGDMKIILLYSAAGRDHEEYEQLLKEHEAHDEPPPKAP